MREVLDNDTTTRYEIYLNGLGVKKVELIILSMILKTGIELSEDCNVFNSGSLIPHKGVRFKDRTIVLGIDLYPTPRYVIPGEIGVNLVKKPPQI